MTARIRTECSRPCDKCGEKGSFFFDVDATCERREGDGSPEFIPNRGVRLEDGVFYCLNCGAQFA
jgi:hypothetical protein